MIEPISSFLLVIVFLKSILALPASDSSQRHESRDVTATSLKPSCREEESSGFVKDKRTGPYYVARELSYAKVKLDKSKMTLPQWRSLLQKSDQEALRIKAESDQRLERESKLRLLRRKLRIKPNDEIARNKLIMLGQSEEEYKRRFTIWLRRKPMSKSKRDGLMHRINKFRFEIDHFNNTGQTVALHLVTRKKYVKKLKIPVESDARYEEGNAKADRIENVIEEMRQIFHKWPLDPLLYPLWVELDEWMREAQVKYRPIILPTVFPQRINMQSKSRDNHAAPNLVPLDETGLDKIDNRFESKEAFMESLFGDVDIDNQYARSQVVNKTTKAFKGTARKKANA